MKETVEHNNRFYTNEKGEIKTENEQLKEWLLIANKENERLNNDIKELLKENSNKEKVIIAQDNIIKEVRECINHYAIENEDYSKIYNDEEKELLDIVNKALGGDSNEN